MDRAPHGKALRHGRRSIPSQLYLVTFCTQHRRPLFLDWCSGHSVVSALRHVDAQLLTSTFCYVVMPDHVHWLFELKSGLLSDTVKALKSRSAILFNQHSGCSGPIWQRGFHDHAIRMDEDLRALARYVIANPLRKGLVEDIGQYSLWDAVWLDERNRGQGRSYNPLDL